jgi:hypothetical protein
LTAFEIEDPHRQRNGTTSGQHAGKHMHHVERVSGAWRPGDTQALPDETDFDPLGRTFGRRAKAVGQPQSLWLEIR